MIVFPIREGIAVRFFSWGKKKCLKEVKQKLFTHKAKTIEVIYKLLIL